MVEWGASTATMTPSGSVRGARKIISDSYRGLVALMADGTLRSGSKNLDSVQHAMDIVARDGSIVVIDSGHVARTFTSGDKWRDTVCGVQAAALTPDGTWYLRDDGVVLNKKFTSPFPARDIPFIAPMNPSLDPLPELGKFKKIVAGYSHVSGLREDGTVLAWGDSSHGQTKVPSNLSGVVDIQAGWCHTTALKVDGSVESWGIPCPKAFTCPILVQGPSRMPEGRASIASVAAKENLLGVLHKDGTLSMGIYSPNNLTWNQRLPGDARGLTEISVSGWHVLALDSSGGLHAWKPDGEPYSLPTEVVLPDGRTIPFRPVGIAAISANDFDAIQTKDGRLLVNTGEGLWKEAASETRGAIQILSANNQFYALLADGTVLEMEHPSPASSQPQGATGIRRMFGGDGWNFAALDSSGHLVDDRFMSYWTTFDPDRDNTPPLHALSTLDLDVWSMVASDSVGQLVARGDYRGPVAPVDVPRLSSVATGRSFAVGVLARSLQVASAKAGPGRILRNNDLEKGHYPIQIIDPRASLVWEGVADWNGSSWKLPLLKQGLVLVRATTHQGVRTEKRFLSP